MKAVERSRSASRSGDRRSRSSRDRGDSAPARPRGDFPNPPIDPPRDSAGSKTTVSGADRARDPHPHLHRHASTLAPRFQPAPPAAASMHTNSVPGEPYGRVTCASECSIYGGRLPEHMWRRRALSTHRPATSLSLSFAFAHRTGVVGQLLGPHRRPQGVENRQHINHLLSHRAGHGDEEAAAGQPHAHNA